MYEELDTPYLTLALSNGYKCHAGFAQIHTTVIFKLYLDILSINLFIFLYIKQS